MLGGSFGIGRKFGLAAGSLPNACMLTTMVQLVKKLSCKIAATDNSNF